MEIFSPKTVSKAYSTASVKIESNLNEYLKAIRAVPPLYAAAIPSIPKICCARLKAVSFQ